MAQGWSAGRTRAYRRTHGSPVFPELPLATSTISGIVPIVIPVSLLLNRSQLSNTGRLVRSY